MPEKLRTQSHVVLFGKIVDDLKVDDGKKETDTGKARVARVYGYSFGGVYHEMMGAALIVVHGKGTPALSSDVPGPHLDDDNPFYKSLQVWTYDHSDQTTRLDVESGTFEQVLLADGGDGGPGVSGARVSGARVSGARVSGARVSGARVSGARVSGARISGARDAGD